MTFAKLMNKTIKQCYENAFRQRDPNGMFGIELELEFTGLEEGGELPENSPRGWLLHNEGSLRGGIEYVTSGGVNLPDVEAAVNNVARYLNERNFRVNLDAHRTSTHIHYNVQNKSFIDTMGIITLFTMVEPLFVRLCGNRRDGNAFCAGSFETGDLPYYILEMCRSLANFEKNGILQQQGRGKYASLSTFRLHDLGTLEFRCFPNSIDGREVSGWCEWINNIAQLVDNETDKSFRAMLKRCLNDPWGFAATIFGNDAWRIDAGISTSLIQMGCQNAYELTRILNRAIVSEPKKKDKAEVAAKDTVQIDIADMLVGNHDWVNPVRELPPLDVEEMPRTMNRLGLRNPRR